MDCVIAGIFAREFNVPLRCLALLALTSRDIHDAVQWRVCFAKRLYDRMAPKFARRAIWHINKYSLRFDGLPSLRVRVIDPIDLISSFDPGTFGLPLRAPAPELPNCCWTIASITAITTNPTDVRAAGLSHCGINNLYNHNFSPVEIDRGADGVIYAINMFPTLYLEPAVVPCYLIWQTDPPSDLGSSIANLLRLIVTFRVSRPACSRWTRRMGRPIAIVSFKDVPP